MKPLDPQIRRLLDEVNAADLPPAHLEDQLWQQLAPRLGDALPPTAAAASSTLATKSGLFMASSPLLKLSLGALIAGASATAIVQHNKTSHEARPALAQSALTRARDTTQEAQASVAPVSHAAEALGSANSVNAIPSASAPSRREVRTSERVAKASSRGGSEVAAVSGSTLVAETQLLARAQRALRDGKPTLALPLIEQHAKAYPRGALAQERDAARVLALCALGRSEDARRSQQQFLKTWPGSPLAERVQQACPPR